MDSLNCKFGSITKIKGGSLEPININSFTHSHAHLQSNSMHIEMRVPSLKPGALELAEALNTRTENEIVSSADLPSSSKGECVAGHH